MTPEQKAKELVEKYKEAAQGQIFKNWGYYHKTCAIITVDEIMKDKHSCGCEQSVIISGAYQTYVTYWQQVKTEIQKL